MSARQNTLGSLMDGPVSLLKYIISRLWLSVLRRLGRVPRLKHHVRLTLQYRNKPFEFYLRDQLDFDLLQDTFLTEEYLLPEVQTPKIIFDLGSNIGDTVIFYKLLYPSAIVYAFEPDPRNLSSLRKNCAQFGDSVVLIPRAVVPDEDQETVTFYQAVEHHWSSSTVSRAEATKKVTVSAVTLESIMRQHGVHKIDICKFDIEGAEYEVFESFNLHSAVDYFVGEMHPTLFKKTTKEFIGLFKIHQEIERRPGEIVILKNKKLH